MKRSRLLPLFALLGAFTLADLVSAAAPLLHPAAQLRAVKQLEAGEPVRIVAFGDSITGVYYHTGNRRAWCDLVGLALERAYPGARPEMINAGISGNTTVDALKRIERDVIAHHPHLVLVMFGMNDVTRVPIEDFRANLRQIVGRIRQADAEVLLMTPNFVSSGDARRPAWKVSEYAQITRDVGRELNVPVADNFRVFQTTAAVDPRNWLRLMSDTIHPNLQGHRLLAEEVVLTLSGRRVVLDELPPNVPTLPHLLQKLEAKEPVRVVAMKPYDTLIIPAIQRVYPEAQVEVIPWDVTHRAISDIEADAKTMGWPLFEKSPDRPKPDLVVIAVPADSLAATEAQFFHSYIWTLNWSQSYRPGEWDCIVVLPSVAQPDQDPAERAAEAMAMEVIHGQDLPWLQRTRGSETSPDELLAAALAGWLRKG